MERKGKFLMGWMFAGTFLAFIVETIRMIRRASLDGLDLEDWQMGIIWIGGLGIGLLMFLYGCYEMRMFRWQ